MDPKKISPSNLPPVLPSPVSGRVSPKPVVSFKPNHHGRGETRLTIPLNLLIDPLVLNTIQNFADAMSRHEKQMDYPEYIYIPPEKISVNSPHQDTDLRNTQKTSDFIDDMEKERDGLEDDLREILVKYKGWNITKTDNGEFSIFKGLSSSGPTKQSVKSETTSDTSRIGIATREEDQTLMMTFQNINGNSNTFDVLKVLNKAEIKSVSEAEIRKIFRREMAKLKGCP